MDGIEFVTKHVHMYIPKEDSVGATNKIKKEKNYRKGRYTMEHF